MLNEISQNNALKTFNKTDWDFLGYYKEALISCKTSGTSGEKSLRKCYRITLLVFNKKTRCDLTKCLDDSAKFAITMD